LLITAFSFKRRQIEYLSLSRLSCLTKRASATHAKENESNSVFFFPSLDQCLRNERGSNLAPGKESISNEAIPKSAARVINALKIRDDYRKKRNLEQEGHDDKIKHKRQRTEDTQLKIKPGESIQHFYRCDAKVLDKGLVHPRIISAQ